MTDNCASKTMLMGAYLYVLARKLCNKSGFSLSTNFQLQRQQPIHLSGLCKYFPALWSENHIGYEQIINTTGQKEYRGPSQEESEYKYRI